MSYQHYPLSVAKFFKSAFKRVGHEVFSVGPYHERIPWAPQNTYAEYQDVPDLLMPSGVVGNFEYVLNHPLVEDFAPEVCYQFDAAYSLRYRNWETPPMKTVHIATDPHCIDYVNQFKQAHYPVIMQKHYGLKYIEEDFSPQWLPYAFDPLIHYWNPKARKEWDVTLISGLMYENRKRALAAFTNAGLKVKHVVGALYTEGTELYNKGRIAFNWSSERDLPMRFWEGLAYRNVVLTNRVPDLAEFPEFIEGVHYLAFSTVEEAVEKALWVVKHEEEAEKMATLGYARVWIGRHTYNQRVQRLLRIAGYT